MRRGNGIFTDQKVDREAYRKVALLSADFMAKVSNTSRKSYLKSLIPVKTKVKSKYTGLNGVQDEIRLAIAERRRKVGDWDSKQWTKAFADSINPSVLTERHYFKGQTELEIDNSHPVSTLIAKKSGNVRRRTQDYTYPLGKVAFALVYSLNSGKSSSRGKSSSSDKSSFDLNRILDEYAPYKRKVVTPAELELVRAKLLGKKPRPLNEPAEKIHPKYFGKQAIDAKEVQEELQFRTEYRLLNFPDQGKIFNTATPTFRESSLTNILSIDHHRFRADMIATREKRNMRQVDLPPDMYNIYSEFT